MTKKKMTKAEALAAYDPEQELDLADLPQPWTKAQAQFVLAMFSDPKRNATKAAIKAGYSEGSAYSIASDFLNKPENTHIQGYIKVRERRIMDKIKQEAEDLMAENAILSSVSLDDFMAYDDRGQPFFDLANAPKEKMKAIKSIKIKELAPALMATDTGEIIPRQTLEVDITLWDKGQAIDRALKVAGKYAPNKTELTGKDGSPLLTSEADREIIARYMSQKEPK